MDLGAGLTDIAAHALCLQTGVIVALALALGAGFARASGKRRRGAALIAAENDSLRDELWGLKEAASARDRAEAASEAKSRFLTTMSHEVRTPISGILGMADLLRDASLDPENASYVEAIREFRERAYRASRRNSRSGQDRGRAFRFGRRDGRPTPTY